MSRLFPAALCSVLCIASSSAHSADEPAVPPPPAPTIDATEALPTVPDAAVHPAPPYAAWADQACPAPGYTSLYDAGYHWYRPEAVVPGTNAGLHLRYPYYSYRRPWYPAGPASVNVTIIW